MFDTTYMHEPWREDALCQGDTEGLFFSDSADIGRVAAAKAICSSCPVIDECLAYAIDTGQPDGIWGGHTAKERRKLRSDWLKEVRRAS
ncbi:MAG: WhiB family transcriptional regulator [Acidimicrobiia bacterium]|nr:WhiB family transcriptional regulator [Acidimicrobiia bacterium]